ncbi:MAG: CGNR zinc finger domain-containing protein [Solirubrobacteraceae bacterium]
MTLTESIPEHEYGFHFMSGRLCLDLVATVGERWRRSFERLRTPTDLARWLVEAGVLEGAPKVTEAELVRARELREAIYRTAKLAGSRAPAAADVTEINRWAIEPTLAPQLTADGRSVAWFGHRPAQAALATIARDAIELVSGPFAARVRECERPDCALLFVDTSRPGRRRWCSMTACGNRTKTAAYRRRQDLAGRAEEGRRAVPQA